MNLCIDCNSRPVYCAGLCEPCMDRRQFEKQRPEGVAARAAGQPRKSPYAYGYGDGWYAGWDEEDRRIYNLPASQIERSARVVEQKRRELERAQAEHEALVLRLADTRAESSRDVATRPRE